MPDAEETPEQNVELPGGAANVEFFEDFLAPGTTKASAESRIDDDALERICELIGSPRSDEVSGAAILDEFRNPVDSRGDSGQPHGHGLHKNDWKTFSEARKAEHGGARIQILDGVLADRPCEYDLRVDPQPFGLAFESLSRGTGPDQDDTHRTSTIAQERDGTK